jgi:hypothetical protein
MVDSSRGGTVLQVKGLDQMQRELRKIQDRLESVAGTHQVSADRLLTPRFIQTHTDYETVDEWFAASPFKIENTADFAAIPDDQWDAYVQKTTSFLSWQEMLTRAGTEYLEAVLAE